MILYIYFFFVDEKVILLLNMAIVKICLEPQDLLQVFACKGKKKDILQWNRYPLLFGVDHMKVEVKTAKCWQFQMFQPNI